MKKIILTAIAATIFGTQPALASMENSFYLKMNGGWEKLKKFHGLKSKNALFLGLGSGYYVTDNIRADVIFDHFIGVTHKGSKTRYGAKRNHKTKGKIESLTLNGYANLFDISVAKVFVGAGVGVAQVEAKNTFINTTTNNTRSSKYKKKNNFTYALHTGAQLEIAPGINSELSYSYRDFGKTKKNSFGRTASYKGHLVGLGMRFDI